MNENYNNIYLWIYPRIAVSSSGPIPSFALMYFIGAWVRLNRRVESHAANIGHNVGPHLNTEQMAINCNHIRRGSQFLCGNLLQTLYDWLAARLLWLRKLSHADPTISHHVCSHRRHTSLNAGIITLRPASAAAQLKDALTSTWTVNTFIRRNPGTK